VKLREQWASFVARRRRESEEREERKRELLHDCEAEIQKAVAIAVQPLFLQPSLPGALLAETAQRLYKLKRRHKKFTVVCDTRSKIEKICSQSSVNPPNIETREPIARLPASVEVCPVCAGLGAYVCTISGGWEYAPCSCGGSGEVAVDNNYYLAIVELPR
jgi:hypothetical protein